MDIEKYNYYKPQIKELFDSAGVFSKLGFSEELKENFLDYVLLQMEDKNSYKHKAFYYLFRYYLLVFFSLFNISLRFKKYKKILYTSSDKYIWVEVPSLYCRFKDVTKEISGSVVLYFPFFFKGLFENHLNIYKQQEIKTTTIPYDFFSLVYFIKIVLKYFSSFSKLRKLSKEHKELNAYNLETIAYKFVIRYEEYRRLFLAFTQDYDCNGKVFIMDHDKCYETYVIKKVREERGLDFTIAVLNHGSFTGFDLSYIKPVSDYVMCNSLREVRIINKYSNIDTGIVCPVGVPLQSFVKREEQRIIKKEDRVPIIILGTSTSEQDHLTIQMELLELLNCKHINYRFRLRPASAEMDYNNLKTVLERSNCTIGTSLFEDCCSGEKIISFSLDALGECFRLEKSVIVYLPNVEFESFGAIEESESQISVTNNLNVVDSFIESKAVSNHYTVESRKWITSNFGSPEYSIVIDNIRKALSCMI